MTAKDRWTVDLFCPNCLRTGRAELWQHDGWSFSNGDTSTYIDSVTDGFKSVPHRVGYQFYCTQCDVKA